LRKYIGSRPIIACGAGVAIVNDKNEVLLQLRADNNCWGFIGGMMEIGETIEETAKREVFEEVGIKLDSINFFKVYSGKDFYYKYPNGDEVYNVINLFTVKGDFENVIIDNDEVKDARFFAFNEIPENISPPDIKIVKDIVDYYTL
jgi:8-oxo-dGTP pyrophosphatase MutT (NUDIX family)